MKILYKTPEITVEELQKIDVLCASDEAQDNALASYGSSGGVGANSFDFNLGSMM